MASTSAARLVRSKPNVADRQPEIINRKTREGRRLQYELKVIQQPERARACGSGAKSSADRRPVDPPPVVELKIHELDTQGEKTDVTFAYDANFFLFVTLEVARPIAHGRVAPPAAQVPVLTGMPVSGMAYLDRPSEAGYFIFPDLSVRHEGKYRLSFNLYEETKQPKDADSDPIGDKPKVSADPSSPDSSFDWRMELKSDAFDVFSAKKFPGLAESTALSRTVAEQGCRVRIRRDVRMRRRGEGKGNDDFEDEAEYNRPTRAETIEEYHARSRSSSRGSEVDGRQSYEQQRRSSGEWVQPAGHLGFGGQHYQSSQPQFAAPPQPPVQPVHYPAPGAYHQQPQYSQPPQPQSHHYGYDRQFPHPQSAYPSNPPREMHRDEEWPRRTQSMAGHEYSRQTPALEQTFNRNPQPFQGYASRSPGPVSLPPIHSLANKFENSPPGPLSSVRSIAPLHSPTTFERRDERPALFPEHSAPLPVTDASRNGKRSYETTFGSGPSNQSLYNGMRPSTPHDDGAFDDDDDAIFEELKMNYKRADGTEYTRALPVLD